MLTVNSFDFFKNGLLLIRCSLNLPCPVRKTTSLLSSSQFSKSQTLLTMNSVPLVRRLLNMWTQINHYLCRCTSLAQSFAVLETWCNTLVLDQWRVWMLISQQENLLFIFQESHGVLAYISVVPYLRWIALRHIPTQVWMSASVGLLSRCAFHTSTWCRILPRYLTNADVLCQTFSKVNLPMTVKFLFLVKGTMVVLLRLTLRFSFAYQVSTHLILSLMFQDSLIVFSNYQYCNVIYMACQDTITTWIPSKADSTPLWSWPRDSPSNVD